MDTINDIVGKQAYDEIDKLKVELSELYTHFSKIAGDMKTIEITLQGNLDLKALSGSLAEIIAKYKEYDKVVQDIAIKEEKRKKLEAERLLIEERTANLRQQRAAREKKDLDDITSREEKRKKQKEREAKAEIDRLEKERRDREKAELGGNRIGASVSFYQNARKELNALQDALRSYEIQLNRAARSGKFSDEQLKQMRDRIQSTRTAWEELNQELTEVEGASGGSTRSRNQLLVETNQLLREMPNFALSARTGILAISNNLPMFIAAWQRTSQEIDATTNRARGFRGALQQLGKSLLSFETIVIVALTVLIQYQEEIMDWITGVSDAEKAQRNYNAALQESMKSVSSDIALLVRLKSVMNDGNSTIEQRNRLLTQAQEKYVGYFDSIDASTTQLGLMNSEIERQIELLQKQAQQQAYAKVIEDSINSLTSAQANLNTEFGFWENTWNNLRRGFLDLPLYENLSKEAKDYLNRLDELRKAGVISNNDYRTAWVRVSELTKAQEGLNNALEMANNQYTEEQRNVQLVINALSKQRDQLVATHKLRVEQYGFSEKAMVQEIQRLELQIGKWQALAGVISIAEGAKANYNKINLTGGVSAQELEVIKARTDLLKQQRNTSGYVVANEKLLRAEFAKRKSEIDAQFEGYSGVLEKDATYVALVKQAEAELNAALRDNKVTVKDTTKNYWDWQKAIEKTRSELEKLNYEISKANVENENTGLQQIAEDESKSLEDRQEANRLFYLNRRRLAAREADQEERIIENGLTRKAELEAKIGYEINTEEDLRRLEREKRLTNEQKDFLASTLNYGKQRILIQDNLAARLSEIDKQESDAATDIIKSDYDRRIKEYSDGMQRVANEIKAATNIQISDLAKLRDQGLISETEYFNRFDAIIKKEGSKVLESQIKFSQDLLASYKTYMASDEFKALPEETKKIYRELAAAIETGIGDISRRIQKDTSQFGNIGDRLSKTLGMDKKDVDLMVKSVIDTFSEMFSTLNTLWDNYYAKRQAALDLDSKKQQEKYEDDKYRIESSLLNEEEKEKQLRDVEAQRLANERTIDRERKRIEIEQAKRQQAMALVEITIKTAAGIADVWSKHAANPVVAGVLTGALLAQMAMQIAKIQSTPIPAYEFGTPESGHPGGLALVGEKRRELAITPGGGMFYTPGVPTVMNLPTGTHVIPNPDAMGSFAKMEAVAKFAGIDRAKNGMTFDDSKIITKLDGLISTISKKPETQWVFENGGLSKYVRSGNVKVKYKRIM